MIHSNWDKDKATTKGVNRWSHEIDFFRKTQLNNFLRGRRQHTWIALIVASNSKIGHQALENVPVERKDISEAFSVIKWYLPDRMNDKLSKFNHMSVLISLLIYIKIDNRQCFHKSPDSRIKTSGQQLRVMGYDYDYKHVVFDQPIYTRIFA